jgi:hypothetical protein
MTMQDRPNPFQVLGLPTNATKAEIVARANELIELAETNEQRLEYRWASEQLITRADTRLGYELFEMPGAVYEDLDWERFARKFGRRPVDVAALASDGIPLTLQQFNLEALARLFLDGVLRVSEPDLASAVDGSRVEFGVGPPPLEVRDVIFG